MDLTSLSFTDPVNGKAYPIHRMIQADLDQVITLERRLFKPPWSRQAFATELEDTENSFPVVIKDGEAVIAYMVVYFVFEEVHLANIAVAPEYQQRGLAEWMLQVLTQYSLATGRDIIHLEVRQSNDRAIRLYRRMGFVVNGLRRRYYENKEDALLMSKKLSGRVIGK